MKIEINLTPEQVIENIRKTIPESYDQTEFILSMIVEAKFHGLIEKENVKYLLKQFDNE